MLLPATDVHGALFVAQDLVQRAAALVHPGVGSVTVSVGVASLGAFDCGEPEAPARLLRHADQALYVAKGTGRHQARVVEDEDAVAVDAV